MSEVIETAVKALEQLSAAIMNSYSDDRPLNEIWGWNQPPLTRTELAAYPAGLAVRLGKLADKPISKPLSELLEKLPARATFIRSSVVPNLPGSNAFHVVPQITELVDLVERRLPAPPPPVATVDWKEVGAKGLLPKELLTRLRSIEGSLKAIEPRTAKLSEQVDAIEAAHEAAEGLPTDLATLGEARDEITASRESVQEAVESVRASAKEIEDVRKTIAAQAAEAAQLVENCGEAYRITTTKGLAASFDLKAKSLSRTLWFWIAGLVGALGVGAFMATQRLELIKAQMATTTSDGRLWIHLLLAVLSVGAPVWFAWIATKQIGQRFRLAEDYAFKASVAKAYEGYRREAARIDPKFEARLFGSALTRLEEAPLRLVETETWGSPWHELTSSPAFQKALGAVPELRETYKSAAQHVGGAAAALAATIPAKRNSRAPDRPSPSPEDEE